MIISFGWSSSMHSARQEVDPVFLSNLESLVQDVHLPPIAFNAQLRC